MTTLQKLQPIKIYQFKSHELRVVGSFEEPWFAAKDICEILGISNTHQSLLNIPDKWKGVCKVSTIGRGDQDMSIVNESGLYKMILRSNKPEAQPFQEWVCEDVLPSIRKKGEYVLEEYKKKLEEQQNLLQKTKEILDEKENTISSQASVLEKKDQHIRKLQREKQVVDGRNCVYLCTAEGKENEGIYTVGQTINIETRLKTYNANKLFQFKMTKYISCKSFKLMDAIETILLAKFNKYKIVSNRDVFQLPEGKDVSFFIQWYDYIAKFCEDIEEDIELEERTEEEQKELMNERKMAYGEQYYEENRETLLEKKKDYYDENIEELALKNKIYREENREILAAKDREYYDKNRDKELVTKKKYYLENKEKILEKTKIYGEENKEKILKRTQEYRNTHKEKIKKYHEENKEKIREQQREKSKEKVTCECGMVVTRYHMNRHKKSQSHQNFLKHPDLVQTSTNLI